MTTHSPGYPVTRADAELVLTRHVASIDSPGATRRTLSRQTIRRFLRELSEPGQPDIVLTEDRLLQWMLGDVAGRCVTLAVRRLILLGGGVRRVGHRYALVGMVSWPSL